MVKVQVRSAWDKLLESNSLTASWAAHSLRLAWEVRVGSIDSARSYHIALLARKRRALPAADACTAAAALLTFEQHHGTAEQVQHLTL